VVVPPPACDTPPVFPELPVTVEFTIVTGRRLSAPPVPSRGVGAWLLLIVERVRNTSPPLLPSR